jgi:hypothetical protein
LPSPEKEVPLPLFSTTHNKLEPIYRFCRPLIGRRRGQRHNTPPFCEMWIGISADENARRCKPSQEGWVTNRYPLRELGLTRADCVTWLWDHYQIVVPKSACVGCLAVKMGSCAAVRRRTDRV